MNGEPDNLILPQSKAAGLNTAVCVNPIRWLLSKHLDLLLEDETVCVVCVYRVQRGFLCLLPDINAGFWSCSYIYQAQIANGVPKWDLMTSQEA